MPRGDLERLAQLWGLLRGEIESKLLLARYSDSNSKSPLVPEELMRDFFAELARVKDMIGTASGWSRVPPFVRNKNSTISMRLTWQVWGRCSDWWRTPQ